MQTAYHVSVVVSIILFGAYGVRVLFADGMVEEFERFGLSRFRRLTGMLEVLGAVGLAAGYVIPGVTLISALGLACLMVLGVGVRVRARDSWLETSPALFLLMVNAFIAVQAVRS